MNRRMRCPVCLGKLALRRDGFARLVTAFDLLAQFVYEIEQKLVGSTHFRHSELSQFSVQSDQSLHWNITGPEQKAPAKTNSSGVRGTKVRIKESAKQAAGQFGSGQVEAAFTFV